MPDGMPSASQLLLYADNLAGVFKAAYGLMGVNAPGEANTLASLAATAKTALLGDGVASYGLGAPLWQGQIAGTLANLVTSFRYDVFWKPFRPLCTQLDNLVKYNLPPGWNYMTNSTQAHVLDFELTRKNAIHPLTPSTPGSAGTLAGIPDSAGALPNTSAGNAPRVIYTLVSPFDYIESLPGAECTQVALTGANNAYSLTITGTVPSNVAKVRVYRTLVGGATGTYYWDQDVSVSGGAAYPVITLRNGDSALRQDISPPSWMSCLVTPELATFFALCFAGVAGGVGPLGFGLVSQPAVSAGTQLQAPHMLSPINVLAGPSNGYLGLGNTAQTGVFGVSQVTAANTQTFTPGALQTANAPSANVQGFAGATGMQARVISALNAACTVSVSYTYLDAAHGQLVQTATLTSSAFGGTAIGNLAAFAVPVGRLVLSVTVTAIAGANAGAFVVEPTIRTVLPSTWSAQQPYAAPGSTQAGLQVMSYQF